MSSYDVVPDKALAEIARLQRRVRKLEGLIVNRFVTCTSGTDDEHERALLAQDREAERIEARRARKKRRRRRR